MPANHRQQLQTTVNHRQPQPPTAMPFNPTLPAANSPLASAEMRAQLTSLNTDIQTRATQGALNSAIAGSSANTNSVGTLVTHVSKVEG